MQSGFGVESVDSMVDDGDNPLKPGHLILLDAPNLGLDRRITPFLYQKEGRIGKQSYRAITERMEKEEKGKNFKDPKFMVENALFDAKITEKLKEG